MASRSTRDWLLALVLVAVTILAYQPAWHAGFIWDDDIYITNNPLLTAPDGLRRIWFSLDSPSQYFPLVYTVFRFEHALWGNNPAGYHWVNLLLHAANALLLWRVLKKLNIPGAWLAAAIFALHAVQVESVAWVTELKNVLSLFFVLLTTLSWIEFLRESEKPRWGFYALALAAFALALFSKTTACTLPAALLLILCLRRERITAKRVLQIVPFLLFGLAMGLVTIWWERYHINTQGKLFSLNLLERALVAGHAIWFYLGKLFWPTNLAFSYPKWEIHANHVSAYGWWIGLAALALLIYFLRRRVGRSLEVTALFYIATLSPVLGFIMLYTFRYSYVADHYQYIASIGPIALVSAGIVRAFEHFGPRKNYFLPVSAAVLLCSLAVLTFRQSTTYTSLETLWRATVERNPNSWIGHNNLGTALREKGDVVGAIEHYRRATELEPTYPEAYNNLGNALVQLGRTDEAITAYRKALENEPGFAEAYYNLGIALAEKGKPDEAVACYQNAVAIRPDFVAARINLGDALLQNNQFDAATAEYEKILRRQPDNANVHHNLASALFKLGRPDEAIAHFQSALRARPDFPEARNNLRYIAWLLATSPDAAQRNGPKAVEISRELKALPDGNTSVNSALLAAAYAAAGDFSNAVATVENCIQSGQATNPPGILTELETQRAAYQKGELLLDTNLKNATAR